MKMLRMAGVTWVAVLFLATAGCSGSVDGGGGEGGAGAAGAGTGATGSGTGGAGGGMGNSCDTLPALPKLASCARPKDEMFPPNMFDVALSGPVLAMGDVNTPGGCFPGASPDLDPNAFWFEATDANGVPWIAGLSFPGLQAPIAMGDTIVADLSYQFGGFGPTVSSFSLRDANGKLLAYAGEAGDLPDLVLPAGVTAAKGAALCNQSDTCGDWSAYDLEVTADGATKTVGYAASDTIGTYRVVHGGYELASSYSMMCADWYVAHVEIGVAPAP